MEKGLWKKDKEAQRTGEQGEKEERNEIWSPDQVAYDHATQKTQYRNDRDPIEIPLLLWVGKEVLNWKRIEFWYQGEQPDVPFHYLDDPHKYTAADKQQNRKIPPVSKVEFQQYK